jgi:hypothetical protein
MESEAISLEERIDDARHEKERLMQDIVDIEYVFMYSYLRERNTYISNRNVKMLWEKKIQLGKETQVTNAAFLHLCLQ